MRECGWVGWIRECGWCRVWELDVGRVDEGVWVGRVEKGVWGLWVVWVGWIRECGGCGWCG